MKLRELFITVVLAVGLPWPATAVTREELVCPVRADWKEGSEECPCEEGWKPTEEQLRNMLAVHMEWLKKRASQVDQSETTIPGQAILCKADLSFANLENSNLAFSNLEQANFEGANLARTIFAGANLEGAILMGANLRKAKLWSANLRGAAFGATNLDATQLAGATLERALYAPASPPPDGNHLVGLTGLASVVILYDEKSRTTLTSGMVQLRKLLQEAGLREQERQATFAIEHHKALHAREHGSAIEQFGGWLQLILFEGTTGWGLYPGRALAIMLALMGGFGFVYAIAVWDPPIAWSKIGSIVRVRPAERVVDSGDEPKEAGSVSMETVCPPGLVAAVGWGLYFSMLSAFHIGWRDLNVGTWISRVQPSEFALRGRGWVRVVSGAQSLISVYLVAMWVLTYFGRPFQ